MNLLDSVIADSHENNADVGVSSSYWARYAALYLELSFFAVVHFPLLPFSAVKDVNVHLNRFTVEIWTCRFLL